eukprot:9410180-Pyramimonas_sp.AAC.1
MSADEFYLAPAAVQRCPPARGAMAQEERERDDMQSSHDTVGPVNEREHDLSLDALMGDVAETHVVAPSGPIPLVSGASEVLKEHRVGPGESEVSSVRAGSQSQSQLSPGGSGAIS